MTDTYNIRYRIAGHPAASWTAANPVLLARELGLETDTGLIRYGDGTSGWNALSEIAVSWGRIVGTLSAQTDLQAALDAKQATITPAALTKTDDTNVTLTLGGSPSTALLAAASLTLGWTGQLAVSRGGTGVSTSTGSGANVLGTAPTFTTSIAVSSTTTANVNFTSDSAGTPKTGLFQIDTIGNMVFRQNTSGSMFFDFINAVNFRNSSFTNVFAISSAGVTSILGNVTSKTTDAATLGTSSLRWLAGYIASLYTGIRTITSTVTVASTDATILCDATSGAITVNLPAASEQSGRTLTIKKIDSSANTVIIDANGSETIDGATTKVISTQWSSLTFQCNGTAWFIL